MNQPFSPETMLEVEATLDSLKLKSYSSELLISDKTKMYAKEMITERIDEIKS